MADAQYVVDVAAQMSGGAQTIAQLDTLASTLMAAGVSADNLHDAVALASNALASAKTSSAEANAALVAGATEFKNLEQAAVQAGKAQEKAARLGVVPPEVAAALDSANAALEQQTAALRGLEGAASAAAQKEAQLTQTLSNVKTAAAAGTQALAAEAAATKAAADATGKAAAVEAAEVAKKAKAIETAQAEQAAATKKSVREAEGFSPLSKQLGDFGDAMSTSEGQAILLEGAAVGVSAAVLAVTVAVVAGVIALASYAVGLADVKRDATLTTQAAEALTPGLAALHGEFAQLSAETGASGADLRTWTKQLKDAKVHAADMPAALRAVALADAALGKGQGLSAFQDSLHETKKSVAETAATFDKSLGGIVEQKMRGLDAQSAKLHKNFGDLFGGLNIEPVLAGMKVLVDLFDQNTVAGKLVKDIFETVFQPLIDQAENASYVVEAFVLGFLIGVTKLYIAVKPAIKAIEELFGFNDTSLADVLDVAQIAGVALAATLAGFLVIVGLMIVTVGLAVAPLIAVAAAVAALVAGVLYAGSVLVDAFIGAWNATSAFLDGLPAKLVAVGGQLMQGLADGITGAAGAVVSAITGAVGSAVDSAKHLLGIHSPSTVFAEIGGYTGEGFVQGVDAMTGEAQAAMAGMVAPPDTSAPAITGNFGAGPSATSSTAQDGGGGKRGGGGSLLGTNNTFKFYGVQDAEQAEGRFEEMLLRVLEGDASSLIPSGAT